MKSIRFFLPRIEYILFAAIFWSTAASGPRILNFDGDLPRHILTGNLIMQTLHVPTTDIFSFRTVGFSSVPHEWLAQVFLAGFYDWMGLNGVVLLTSLLVTLTWVIVYRTTFHRSNGFFASLIFTALAMAASQIHVLPRPHLFTYVLTAIWIVLLDQIDENKTRTWWTLPLMMLLWVNLHGMFVLGIVIWGIYIVGDFLDHPSKAWFNSAKAKALAIGGVSALASTFLSPSGVNIWQTIAALGSNAYITSRIPEYQSANFHAPETWPFIFILILTLLTFSRTTQKIPWAHVLLVIAFAGIALYTSRMIPMFAIVATPIVAKAFTEWTNREYHQSRLLTVENNISKINTSSNGLVWVIVVMVSVAYLFNSGKTIDLENRGNVFDKSFFPVDATTWFKDHPQKGHMFNEFDWGGYLLLNLWPHQQIFMDGHTHIYGEKLTREYDNVISLNTGWEQILTKYKVDWVIVRINAPLAKVLSTSSNWTIVYQDQTAIILIRK